MNNKWQIIFLAVFAATLVACSDKTPAQKTAVEKEHFLTEKMQTIKKAEQVNQLLQDTAKKQRREIEEQGG